STCHASKLLATTDFSWSSKRRIHVSMWLRLQLFFTRSMLPVSGRCRIRSRLHLKASRIVLTAFGLAVLAGCRQDMHDQPKYIPLRVSSFFGDNRSERNLPLGTVARGDLREDTYYYTGRVGNQDGTVFPFAITATDLRRGQDRYN